MAEPAQAQALDVLMEAGRRHLQVDIENHLRDLFPDGQTDGIPLPVIMTFLAGAVWRNCCKPVDRQP